MPRYPWFFEKPTNPGEATPAERSAASRLVAYLQWLGTEAERLAHEHEKEPVR